MYSEVQRAHQTWLFASRTVMQQHNRVRNTGLAPIPHPASRIIMLSKICSSRHASVTLPESRRETTLSL
jgi:hypothetical protein